MPLLTPGKEKELMAAIDEARQRTRNEMAMRVGEKSAASSPRPGFFESCANPVCRSGWLHLWRSRTAPLVEGGWSCSPECTQSLVAAALRREMDGWGGPVETHRHRIPLGLLMMRQGWITSEHLRKAVEAQKTAGGGRLGYWLVRQQGVGEPLVTRALAMQWGCPVLGMEFHDAEGLTPLVPRLFVDAFGALPLRVAAGKILYLGFEDRLDPVLALALERMTGLRVESGVVQESLFRPAHTRILAARFPSTELIEAVSEPVLAEAISRRLERFKPVDSRLIRVHDCFWMRLWKKKQTGPMPDADSVQDLICTIRAQ
ncbi:hypothetical protein ACOBR2_10160 [Telmatobacter bradus]|uniref:hypothetical protein n=1 Tax=Telmatobacter bradus TaxID=474953 RepID=UPI003B431036